MLRGARAVCGGGGLRLFVQCVVEVQAGEVGERWYDAAGLAVWWRFRGGLMLLDSLSFLCIVVARQPFDPFHPCPSAAFRSVLSLSFGSLAFHEPMLGS